MLTPEQIQERKNGIGGSDAAAVLGLSPWKTALDIYLEKTGQAESNPFNEGAAYWGNVLESVIADEYARRTGVKVRKINRMLRNPDHPFMTAFIDRMIVGSNKILEVKTSARSDGWGEQKTDEVPEQYLVQVLHYLAVTKKNEADIAVLIGGNDFRIYTIKRDRELEEKIIQREGEFWHNHVLAMVPPPPRTFSDYSQLWPSDNGKKIYATQEIEDAVANYKKLKDEIDRLEKEQETHKAQIIGYIKENSELHGSDGLLATYKKAKSSMVFNSKDFQKIHPEIYAQFLTEKEGSRRLLIK